MNRRLPFALAGVLLAAMLSSSTIAQEQGQEHEAAAPKVSMHDLLAKTKATLPQAIETALKARPGVACAAELEGAGKGDDAVAIFEVMILGDDQKVYEVQVNAADRSVRSNEECTDEEDVGEIRDLQGKVGKKVTLLGIAHAAGSVLRGDCVRVEFVAKDKSAIAVMCTGDLETAAMFSLHSGKLHGISLKKGPAKHEDAADEEHEAGEEGEEGEEHGEKAKKAKAGKGKGEKEEAEEEEEGEAGEEGEQHKPAPKKPGHKKG